MGIDDKIFIKTGWKPLIHNIKVQSGVTDGKVCVSIIKTKYLVKSDLVGKSDPYALVKYSTQDYKTSTNKNSQNPVSEE